MPDSDAVGSLNRDIGPLKLWQWGLVVIVPFSVIKLLSRKPKKSGQESTTPGPVASSTAGLTPGELAIQSRQDEGFNAVLQALSDNWQNSGVQGDNIPTNLGILSYNLSELGKQPGFTEHKDLLNRWSAQVDNWQSGYVAFQPAVYNTIAAFLQQANVPLDRIIRNIAPVISPPQAAPMSTISTSIPPNSPMPRATEPIPEGTVIKGPRSIEPAPSGILATLSRVFEASQAKPTAGVFEAAFAGQNTGLPTSFNSGSYYYSANPPSNAPGSEYIEGATAYPNYLDLNEASRYGNPLA